MSHIIPKSNENLPEDLSAKLIEAVEESVRWFKGNAKKVKELLDLGADPNTVSDDIEDGKSSVLLLASGKWGNPDVVKLLLDARANVNQTDMWGYTPLMRATRGHRLRIVNLLLDAGAEVNKERGRGETALDMCITDDHMKLKVRLLEAGARAHDTPRMYSHEFLRERINECLDWRDEQAAS